MDSMKEIAGLLYIALATAAGGRDLLEDSNQILRSAVESGSISHPDTCRAIMALVATTSQLTPTKVPNVPAA